MKIVNAYKKFFNDKSRIVHLMGGAGSAKSFSTAQKIVLRLLNEEGHKFLIIRKVARTLKNSMFDLFMKIIEDEELEDKFTCTTSPMEITYKENGSKLLFLGLDDPEKIKSIVGITGIWIEEATETVEKDFIQLNLRLRGETPYYKQIIFTFNPIDINGWIYKKFYGPEKVYEASIYHTTFKDNPFLDKEYTDYLENLINQSEMDYKIYALGEWGSLSATTIFSNWEIYNKEKHENISMDIKEYDKKSAGIDWGSTHASVCLPVGFKNNTIVILDEIYHKNLTNPEFLNKISDKKYPKELIYYADSAEPSRIREMRQQGFNVVSTKKGKDSVKYALDYLKRYKIIINPKCEHTIKEITSFSYLYDEKTDRIFDEPSPKQEDDTMAALRYSVNKLMRRTNKIKAVPSLY